VPLLALADLPPVDRRRALHHPEATGDRPDQQLGRLILRLVELHSP